MRPYVETVTTTTSRTGGVHAEVRPRLVLNRDHDAAPCVDNASNTHRARIRPQYHPPDIAARRSVNRKSGNSDGFFRIPGEPSQARAVCHNSMLAMNLYRNRGLPYPIDGCQILPRGLGLDAVGVAERESAAEVCGMHFSDDFWSTAKEYAEKVCRFLQPKRAEMCNSPEELDYAIHSNRR
jgi:hypothetical protein